MADKRGLVAVLQTFGFPDENSLGQWIDYKEYRRQLDMLSLTAEGDLGIKIKTPDNIMEPLFGRELFFGAKVPHGLFSLSEAFNHMQEVLAARCSDFAIVRSQGTLDFIHETMNQTQIEQTEGAIIKAREAILTAALDSRSAADQIETVMAAFVRVTDTGLLKITVEEALFDIRKKASQIQRE